MCGEEIKMCPDCKKPGKGKVCTACGTPLTTRKTQGEPPVESGKTANDSPTPPSGGNTQQPANNTQSTYRLPDNEPSKPAMPQVRLLNKNINVDLKIDDNSIIGRTAGQYVATFGRFNQVSGKHCRFNYDPAKGWSVTDLGSTNKTKYNNQEISPNISQILGDQSYLKIANIEFFVRIISG
jgi:pSer/pThr/pTyr-binding forkhead associated (FHA) protein